MKPGDAIAARPAHVLSRIAAGLLGGYAFVWAFVTLGIAGLVTLGAHYDQAWMLVTMLAFVLFLGVLLWVFAARSLVRVWFVLGGGAVAMTLGAVVLGARLATGP